MLEIHRIFSNGHVFQQRSNIYFICENISEFGLMYWRIYLTLLWNTKENWLKL